MTRTAILDRTQGRQEAYAVKNIAARSFRGLRGAFLLAATLVAPAANAQPTFEKAFSPSTIGPGSVSTLTFTIDNAASLALFTDLAFDDTLPAGMTIATPASAMTTCVDGILTAPVGGATISLSGGRIGSGDSCTVTVNVRATATGMNVSGNLTSSGGSSGSATATLTVDDERPGFSKSFSPSSIPPGGTSTLTFTIDNTANATDVFTLLFTDFLPTGMVVASPPNASTDCSGVQSTTLTADPGTSIIGLAAVGSSPSFPVLPAGSSCTVTVDVTTSTTGVFVNTSGELAIDTSVSPVTSGVATAVLNVPVDFLIKSFTDDPVPPGGAVTLEFTINNPDRVNGATNISFTDDLAMALPGLVATDLPAPGAACNGTMSGDGLGLLTLMGGSLPAEGSCKILVSLLVPAAAPPGSFTNTTTAITAIINGSMVTGNMATDNLVVAPAPLLTKSFTDDPVGPGGTVTLEFTITNTSPTSTATAIAFTDVFNVFLPTASSTPAPGFCGGSSTATFTPLKLQMPPADNIPAILEVSGAELAGGASCTFSVTLDVALGAAAGAYPNTTSEITATVDAVTYTGSPASDTLTVLAAPSLQKSFTDDPVEPGGTVTLKFTLTHSLNLTGPATGITFTDDLAALVPAIAGLTANLPPSPDPPCGVGSTLVGTAGDTLLTLTGGTLTDPGDSCTFSVTLDVPAGAAAGGPYEHNELGDGHGWGLDGDIRPGEQRSGGCRLDLHQGVPRRPPIPGDTVTLRFTIDNVHPDDDATDIDFTDNLSAALSGLAATGAPTTDTCGGALSGTTSLTYIGGSVMSGASCTIEVPVLVPLAAADGTFRNITSDLDTSLGEIDPAVDELIVSSNLLFLTKVFSDDPIPPGGTGTLEFTLTNLDASAAASSISFTDDLGMALPGLVATGLPAPGAACNGTISGASLLTLIGGSLPAEGSCTISVKITDTGTSGPGFYPNTTSGVTGTIGGLPVTGDPAVDDLAIGALGFSKSFSGMPEVGDPVTLTFTISNASAIVQTDIGFTDDLDAVLAGLAPTSLPTDPCGLGSTLSIAAAPATIALTGGTIAPGGSCSVIVPLLVPVAASVNTYTNTSSDLFQAGVVVAPPTTANLVVTGEITNVVTVTADGATPAVGQTTDTILP